MLDLKQLLLPSAQYFRLLLALSAVLFYIWPQISPQAGGIIELADLLAHPDQYDKQSVAVVGEVADLQTATTRDGQSAYGFLLKAGGSTVKVIGLGKTTVHDGAQVVVEGTFNRLRQGGRAVVFNEIKADLVRPLARLTPDFVG